MQVGDLIIGARTLIPDLPRTLSPLAGVTAVPVASVGSTLPAGTYNLVLCATNRWGRTLQSNQVSGIVIGANQGIQVTGPAALPPGATGVQAYFALVGQPFYQFISSSVIPFTISSLGLPGTPPTRSTSFYPDSDGNFISVDTIYQWLNEALITASAIAEGIPDTSGFQTIAGQGLYYLPGIWRKFGNGWWDGFPMAVAGSKDMFYRNRLSGNIPFLVLLQYNAERMVAELQPQPGRTAGASTIAAGLPVAIGDSTINVTSLATFGLSLGLAIIGNYPSGTYEVIEYSGMNGNQLTGCVRGLGGTVESSWPAGSAIVEANCRFTGQRLFTSPVYTPGMSASSINVPPQWQRPLIDYIVNKVREGEQSPQEAARKLQEFTGMIKAACKGNEQVAGPRQVGGTSGPAGDGYQTSGGFRVIVP